MIERIVSGGQTGADRGGLDAARDLGIPFRGWAPKDWRAEDGEIPVEYRASMRTALTRDYLTRTRMNVKDSDGTLIVSLSGSLTGGSLATWRLCKGLGRHCLHLVLRDQHAARGILLDWIGRHRIRVLNVAGPRESKEPGIQDTARRVLASVLRAALR